MSSVVLRGKWCFAVYMLSCASPCPEHHMNLYSRYLSLKLNLSLKLSFQIKAKCHIDSAFCDFLQIPPICQNNFYVSVLQDISFFKDSNICNRPLSPVFYGKKKILIMKISFLGYVIFEWLPLVRKEVVKFEVVVVHYSSEDIFQVCNWVNIVQFTGFD